MTDTTHATQEAALLDAFRRLSPARRDAMVVAIAALTAPDAQAEHQEPATTTAAQGTQPCA